MNGRRELLGNVTVPSGVLVLIDMGLLWIWHGTRPEELPETIDFHIEGPDAEEAGVRFDRSLNPRYWYDIPREAGDEAREQFGEFVAGEGLTANLAEIPGGVPHRERIDLALARGGRFAALEFFGISAPVVAGVPRTRRLPVYGIRMADPEFADRWRWVGVDIADGEVARSEEIGNVAVDEARLMFADADALEHWVHDDPLDDRADYVFWGRDATAAAERFGADDLGGGEYGWVDLPIEEAYEHAVAVDESRESEGWMFAGDFRPHSHHYDVLRDMRAAETEAGVIDVAGATMCAFFTSWGDGFFPVLADFADDGELLGLRIDLGSDATVERIRNLGA